MSFYIICGRFYDLQKNILHIGGIETYVSNLAKIFEEMQEYTTIIQLDNLSGNYSINEYVNIVSLSRAKTSYLDMIKYAENIGNTETDVLLFATSTMIYKTKFKKSMAIQHGIYWDIPTISGKSNIPENVSTYLRAIQARKIIKQHRSVSKMICVDYNYVNWLRSQTTDRNLDYSVIPNFTDTLKNKRKYINSDVLRIVYARRCEVIRGSDLLCDVLPHILKKYHNVSLTISGNGSQLKKIKSVFSEYENVDFTTYQSSESLEFHQNFDIAIVPSIGSEGTSLSLLEAMAAGCAVICTDVGGMSNIILDNYNGLICKPTKENLLENIINLIENFELRRRISQNAIETVEFSFSLERWKNQWKNEIINMR